ncbi:MAG TPA: ATP-binding cassette domain-containing protein [Nevskiaceae bacterium]|nr:ATP-binding cassette domain-containing protein [Nevskiaceae bacterium]
MSKKYAIDVKGLQKSYGKLTVLDGINFTVKPGTILALLGPNGAGKTTTIRILSTLLQPDGGQAKIAGYDVVQQPAQVKSNIGLTGQYAAVDEYLSGEENLLMIGRLYRLSLEDTKRRTHELLKLFDLVEPGKRPVRTYSGGMRRRLDLAMSLIASPPIIFLDEPTTGLDPRSRQTMWDIIKELAKSGTTILLTTQYMEEADVLADNIIVIDGGKVIAEGTANTLKSRVGSDRLEVVIDKKSSLEKAEKIVDGEELQIDREQRILSIASKGGTATFRRIMQRLEDAGIEVESFSLHRPTLDDVFLSLTGHATTKDTPADKPKGKK